MILGWHPFTHPATLRSAVLDVEPFPQTYLKFSPVAKSAEVFVNRRVIRHNGDLALAWAMSNVGADANENIKPNKKKSANKIDPTVVFLMSFGSWQAEH